MKKIIRLLAPSPFKIGFLLVVCSIAFYNSFEGRKPALLQGLDNRLTDAMFHLRGPQPVTGQVVIIDIDNKSLTELGQWPWSRNIVAQLIDTLAAQQPTSILLDIVFAEPDRTSPKSLISTLLPHTTNKNALAELRNLQSKEQFNYDLLLGEALSKAPTVLGYAFSLDTGYDGQGEGQPFPSINIAMEPPGSTFSDLNLIVGRSAILNISDVAMAESEGFFNMYPDNSGTVRKVPLFMFYKGLPYPSLALEGFRLGDNQDQAIIHLTKKDHTAKTGILGVSVGNTFIPTDEKGQLTINYRGPFNSFRYIPAADLLAARYPYDLGGKHIVIGTSAEGLYDLRATPYANIIPGVEIQANIIDNMIAADPMIYDTFTEIGLTYAILMVGGILLTAILAYSTPLAGGLGGLLFIVLALTASYILFLFNRIVGITYPLFSVSIIFLCVTLFNFFFAGREKRYLNDAFKRYVAPEVVQEVIRNPSSLSLKGETKELTVFFSDIRDFTAISERLTPEQLSQLMNEYLTAMSNLIMESGGTVDKFIGDAIMAIWGAPLDLVDQELKAVQTALNSMDVLGKLQPAWTSRGLPTIKIGIGINTGKMRVGNFGSEKRFDYTVIGDNVNLASRLEGLNKTYGTTVLISGATAKAIEGKIPYRYIDMVRVKGKTRPVRIFEPFEKNSLNSIRPQLSLFKDAIELYQNRDFKGANHHFSTLNKKYPHKLYQVYVERSAFFSLNPPSPDWDGVFSFTKK
ncbi:MAG: adenylate/guanylate cyclase domain-containing protein [Proteobacteria bacterium]|nr:adenylate/guanylate cyclase domain-containing protein [Pseudomonadota bacterium]MBU1639927.1 adenylate/guanylate cyclase domain-containing protein [Pseudomonadota bacterium]